MNIVILGAGDIGSFLAIFLSQEQHNVTVIDRDQEKLFNLSQLADVATFWGSGTDLNNLEEIMRGKPDLFLSMTNNDETNLVACTLVKNLGSIKTIARLKNFSRSSKVDFSRLFFVDYYILPEVVVAHEIIKTLFHPACSFVENLAHGAVQMKTVFLNDNCYHNKKLSELSLESLLVGLIKRKGNTIIFPRGEEMILPGDEVTFIGKTDKMQELYKKIGIRSKKIDSVVLIGGSQVSIHLSGLLKEKGISVKIIEKDEKKCHLLARKLPTTTIIHQDGVNPSFLLSEHVEKADCIITSTNCDEKNILAATFIKQAGCKEVIAVISDHNFTPMLHHLNIHSVVSEKLIIANRILAIIHSDGNAISVTSLYENQAKVMEFKITSKTKAVGIPLSDLRPLLPKECLIGMIETQGKIIIPTGSSTLSPGDTAIILTTPEHVTQLQSIF